MEEHTVLLSELGNTAAAVVAIDSSQTIVSWNRGAQSLLGRTADQTLGRKCHDVMRGALRSGKPFCRAGCALKQQAQRNVALRDFEMVLHDSEGGRRAVTTSTIVLPRLGGGGMVHLFRPASGSREPDFCLAQVPSPDLADFTRREIEVLRCLARGNSTSRIAAQLFISPLTVRTHVRNLLRKSNLHNHVQLALFAVRNGLT